jgi:asparagine synthase (glutamine-hydrolysing)
MCGIAGISGWSAESTGDVRVLVDEMSRRLAHRGPDDTAAWVAEDSRVALTHRRLAIVDLSPRGRNPMSWDDGRLVITFNGEIYNFRELRAELEQNGFRFRSDTDTEVILAAYDRWGTDAVGRFAGMFAFALWDRERRRLWLVRDRLGKKPLYYVERAGTLRFASELKALMTDAAFPRVIDRDALQLYLRYGYIPAPLTIFEHARKLPPAHYLVWENGRAALSRYWNPLDSLAARPAEEHVEERFEDVLKLAVRQRMLADVPVGAFLSGGVDSSLIVALMQEQAAQRVKTFTIRFAQAEFNEADHAAAVAQHLGTEHWEDTCGAVEMLGAVDQVIETFDEPFADSSAIPTYLVSRKTRQHVTVALSGDGGDELFFGYPRYRYHADASWALRLPGPVRRAVGTASRRLPNRRLQRIGDVLEGNDSDLYGRFVAWHQAEQARHITGGSLATAAAYTDMFNQLGNVDPALRPGLLDLVTYLPDDILTKVDRASMAVALEVRAPLLDHRVVEFALGLPLSFKRRGRDTKWLLKQLLYRRVPRELVDRPKMGFGVPLRQWFLGPLRDRMDEFCAGDDLEALSLRADPLRTMWQEFKAGRPHRPDLLWQTFVLIAWTRRYYRNRLAA